MNTRPLVPLAALCGAIGVAVGAFGAHALPGFLQNQDLAPEDIERRVEAFETGVRYHMYHAVALLALAIFPRGSWPRGGSLAAGAWLFGILVFSGCLYGYALTAARPLAMIVPLGGLSFIAGWLALCLPARSNSDAEHPVQTGGPDLH